jgi:hypothetical protein
LYRPRQDGVQQFSTWHETVPKVSENYPKLAPKTFGTFFWQELLDRVGEKRFG